MVQPDAGPAAPTFDADVAFPRAVWTASNARHADARAKRWPSEKIPVAHKLAPGAARG
jgi:hypothetical protein